MTNLELKRKVSDAVLTTVKGVSGVGLPGQKITIYLEDDTPEVRSAVQAAVAPLGLREPLQWLTTGKIKAQ